MPDPGRKPADQNGAAVETAAVSVAVAGSDPGEGCRKCATPPPQK